MLAIHSTQAMRKVPLLLKPSRNLLPFLCSIRYWAKLLLQRQPYSLGPLQNNNANGRGTMPIYERQSYKRYALRQKSQGDDQSFGSADSLPNCTAMGDACPDIWRYLFQLQIKRSDTHPRILDEFTSMPS